MQKLVGDNVVVRKLEEKDLPLLWNYRYGEENPEWKKWDAPYFELEYEPLEDYIESMKPSIEHEDCYVIEVNEKVVGSVVYYWEYQPTRWLEVGIGIYDPSYWNGGYGTEALQLWVTEIFRRFPRIARVGLTTWSGNHRMMNAAEKVGMILEGRMRKCRYYNGVYYDSIRMGVLREEWMEKKEGIEEKK
ncbi:GNAT family N-acetyltransferase [Longirhabdus pacifica]|uniref:GNAT family N-acetyltransferase n=1 Tax=Longirhabdus pacifica TaxID=2305227 RepID=UPI00100907EC|nr:GNAT family protein [Longirhabdus pacifica]